MRPQSKTALLAELSLETAACLTDLLADRGFTVLDSVTDGREAVRRISTETPDLVVLDAVLPGLDGLSAAEEILASPLLVRPGIVVVLPFSGLTERRERLEASGCAFLERTTPDALDAALRETALPVRRVAEKTTEYLDSLLDRLGLPRREGRSYLRTAILFAWQDLRLAHQLTGRLYPLVGQRHGCDARKVERAMRRAIEAAWKSGNIEEQYAIFGGTIDAQRGKPTCGEMIAQLADILRLEG